MFVFNVYTAHDYNWVVSSVKTGDDPRPPRQLITGHKLPYAQIMAIIAAIQTVSGTGWNETRLQSYTRHVRA